MPCYRVTKEIAMAAKHGDYFHHRQYRNQDRTPRRVRVTGKCKVWKTRPEEFQLPARHGMYTSGYISDENKEYYFTGYGDDCTHDHVGEAMPIGELE